MMKRHLMVEVSYQNLKEKGTQNYFILVGQIPFDIELETLEEDGDGFDREEDFIEEEYMNEELEIGEDEKKIEEEMTEEYLEEVLIKEE